MRGRSLVFMWIDENFGMKAAMIYAAVMLTLCGIALLWYEIYYFEYRKRGIYQRIMEERAQPPITKDEARTLRKKQRRARQEYRRQKNK